MNRKITRLPRVLLLAALLAALLPALAAGAAAARASGPSDVTGQTRMQTTIPSGRIVLRLAPDSGLTTGPEGLTVRRGAKASARGEAERVRALVGDLAGGAVISSRIPSAAAGAGMRARRGLPDLALYAHFDARTPDRDVLAKMAARLNADPAIDLAWLEPVAVPAALGFDAASGGYVAAPPPPSANFDTLQGYLEDAPTGIGALSMRAVPGALGAGLAMIDVEGAWLWDHEDLPAPFVDLGLHLGDLGWRNHGTAVVGIVRGEDNGLGITGVTPACAVGNASIGSMSVAEAIVAAAAQLAPGDVIVIELHAPGPEANGQGQVGYMPMEFWQDNFDAIRTATAMGVIVCEAAGNGGVDLDRPIYQGLFDRSLRDSGAILVGATNAGSLYAAWFTNHGTRVDLNGWGAGVATLAYGDLQGSPDFPEGQWYTGSFSGTSSATPIVTGAVLGLQGMVRERYGMNLDGRLARDILLATGTTLSSSKLIGTRPDMVAAWELADDAIGEVAGTVTDRVGGLPLEGILVRVAGHGAWTVTAADGTWRLPRLTGPVDIGFSAFGYDDRTAGTVVAAGATSVLDVQMDPTPLVAIRGAVHGGDVPVAGALVTPLVRPVAPVSSGAGGAYALPVPRGHDYRLRFDGVPGYGARIVDVPAMATDVLVSPNLEPVAEDFEGDDGGFTSAAGLWSWGVPPAAVTGPAFSGGQCWGVGMDGNGYADDQADTLTSVIYNLTPQAGVSSYRLSFHFWSETEAGYDGVQLLATANILDWEVLSPVEGYPDDFLGGLELGPGWSGHGGRWQGTVFDITDYAGGLFQFKLVFGSDGGVVDEGFYVDGITFGTGRNAAPAPRLEPLAAAAGLRAWPNPFNPRVNVAWEVPRPGRLEVAVFDLRGRRVRTLLAADVPARQGVVVWDGRDASGRAAASGVYLVQLRTADGRGASERVVLAK